MQSESIGATDALVASAMVFISVYVSEVDVAVCKLVAIAAAAARMVAVAANVVLREDRHPG